MAKKVTYGKTLLESLGFALDPHRWVPFFALDVIVFSIVAIFLTTNLPLLSSLIVSSGITLSTLISMTGIALPLLIIGVVWLLLKIWISGAIIHQSYKEKEFNKSWSVSCARYTQLFGVVIILGLIGIGASSIPIAGGLVAIIVSLLFFFALQPVILRKKDAISSLKESYNIFRKNIGKVILIWIGVAFVGSILAGIFIIPLMALIMATAIDVTAKTAPEMLLSVLSSNLPMTFVTVIIFLLGLSISKVFQLKAQTDFYKQLKSKF